MRIGPHASVVEMTSFEEDGPWNAAQVFPGDPKRTRLDEDVPSAPNHLTLVCHTMFVTHAIGTKQWVKPFHKKALWWCSERGIENYVCHLGATKGRELAAVLRDFEGFLVWLESVGSSVKFLLENSAAAYIANQSDELLTLIRNSTANIGLCIDTCHAYSAGWSDEEIVERLREYKPEVIHFNAPHPGVERGGGRDRHGWFYDGGADELLSGLVEVITEYDPIVILEGGTEEGSVLDEYHYIKAKIDELPDSKPDVEQQK